MKFYVLLLAVVLIGSDVHGQDDKPRVICHCEPTETHNLYLQGGVQDKDEYTDELPRRGLGLIEHDHKLSVVFLDMADELQSLESLGFVVVESRTPSSATRLFTGLHPISGVVETYLFDLDESGAGALLTTQIRSNYVFKSGKLTRYDCAPSSARENSN